MRRPTARPGPVLALGLAVLATTAVLPAGLDGLPVPSYSWAAWAVVLLWSLVALRRASVSLVAALRIVAWLLPPVLLLTLPVTVFAAAGQRGQVASALVARALAAATAGSATVARLGPAGVVAGLRWLRVPARLVEIVHAMLASLAAIVRQVAGMQRARAARRTGAAPWPAILAAPAGTLRGFGRLVGALFLRSLERAEALERARRARGGADA